MTCRSLTVAAVLAVALVGAGCASDPPPAPTTTSGTALPTRVTRPTMPGSTIPGTSTTTTVPAEIAYSVDACSLLEPDELEAVAGDDPGPGNELQTTQSDDAETSNTSAPTSSTTVATASPPSEGDDPATPTPSDEQDPPLLLLSSCSWPTDASAAITLTYLAPTTSRSAREHLQRIVDLGSRFGDGGRVLPVQPVGTISPSALENDDGEIVEVAVVVGSALVYVVPAEPPPTGSREANEFVSVLIAAARRAPG